MFSSCSHHILIMKETINIRGCHYFAYSLESAAADVDGVEASCVAATSACSEVYLNLPLHIFTRKATHLSACMSMHMSTRKSMHIYT